MIVLLNCGRLFQADGRTIDVAAGLLRGLSVTVREQGGRDSIHGWAMETPAPRRKERREKRERFMGGGSGAVEGRARSFPRSGEVGGGVFGVPKAWKWARDLSGGPLAPSLREPFPLYTGGVPVAYMRCCAPNSASRRESP